MRSRWIPLVLAAALAACSDDNNPAGPTAPEPGNGTATTLKGILAGAGLRGDIEITIAGSAAASVASPMRFSVRGTHAVVAVTGCAYLGVTTCTTITGTYNTATDALNFTTTNPALTFTGTWSNGVIEGSYNGAYSGEFVVSQGTVLVYCGFFDGAASGDWNLVLSGTASPYQVTGVFDDGSGPERFFGSATGASPYTLNVSFSGGTATGTLTATGGTGTWRATGSTSPDGEWEATNAFCRN